MEHEHNWHEVKRHTNGYRIRTVDLCLTVGCSDRRRGVFAFKKHPDDHPDGGTNWWGPVGEWAYSIAERAKE